MAKSSHSRPGTYSQPGLHETLITDALSDGLKELPDGLLANKQGLRPAEAADRIALHLSRTLQRTLSGVPESERVAIGISLAKQLIGQMHAALPDAEIQSESPIAPGTILQAIQSILPDGSHAPIVPPLIPLLDTTLLTNAPGEPRVGQQINTEIHSADRIDVVMAFIMRSGIRPLLNSLREHCQAGRALRILTTTYTNSTECEALEQLQELGAGVRVSYDTGHTRLHAKAWLFHRSSGFTTAYIGSSNLSHMAQVTGLEWNVRLSGARNPDVTDKIKAVFEGYWNSGDFVPFDKEEFQRHTDAAKSKGPKVYLSPVEIRPEPFQERLLELIQLSRQQGHHRNLLVSATGTGKTVMAAIDYLRLCKGRRRTRLLFVAHRAEILEQSLATFRHALRDHAFGELWVGRNRPRKFDHVFASIQSLNASGLSKIDPKHFDVLIIDEFHHAAAPSYKALFDHLRPIELLGLTATPERSDGLPLLHWFDDRIAAELRLWDAIDQHRLTPFLYYGIHDGLDLREIPWRRGRGYDIDGLTNLLTANDGRARLVIQELLDHAQNPGTMRVLGFCVSVAHARFMARVFNEAGLAAVAVWGNSPDAERKGALKDLAEGRIQVVFSVDIFNEGVDVPSVDTLLLLRPTDSATLFLQQLGRGLRRMAGKSACVVLDFVGQHRKEFRFDRRMGALLGGSRAEIIKQVSSGFPFLPAGCHMELDPIASRIVIDNIKSAVPSRWDAKAQELKQLAGKSETKDLTLKTFLERSGLDLGDIYSNKHSWSDLREQAGLSIEQAGPYEKALRRACGRFLHVDDPTRISSYRQLLESSEPPKSGLQTELQRRLLRMLIASIVDQAATKEASLDLGIKILWQHPQVRSELIELLDVLATRVQHVHLPLPERPNVPLQVHARYTRLEIMAAFGVGQGAKVAPWQTGVYWAKEERSDLLAFTLDKTSGQFSPTTRYQDYAISPDLIHWESQSNTRENSATGQRYQKHAEQNSTLMLFARLRTSDRAFWFLGPATYVSHEAEQPMKIKWMLQHPLPGNLFASFGAAVA